MAPRGMGIGDVSLPFDEVFPVVQVHERLDGFFLVENGLECVPVEEPSCFGWRRDLFLFCPLACSCKGGITHQPLTCCDPVDERDHKVDVGNLVEVLGHEVQPVVDAPQALNIDPNPPGRAVFFIGHSDDFIGHSTILANHVFGPIGCNGDHF